MLNSIIYYTTEQQPDEGEWVVGLYNGANWGDVGKQYWKVVQFRRGISQEERAALPDWNERKKIYQKPDEWHNNLVPYGWEEFGPGGHFGQDISQWFRLPEVHDATLLENRSKREENHKEMGKRWAEYLTKEVTPKGLDVPKLESDDKDHSGC